MFRVGDRRRRERIDEVVDARTKARRAASRSATAKDVFGSDGLDYSGDTEPPQDIGTDDFASARDVDSRPTPSRSTGTYRRSVSPSSFSKRRANDFKRNADEKSEAGSSTTDFTSRRGAEAHRRSRSPSPLADRITERGVPHHRIGQHDDRIPNGRDHRSNDRHTRDGNNLTSDVQPRGHSEVKRLPRSRDIDWAPPGTQGTQLDDATNDSIRARPDHIPLAETRTPPQKAKRQFLEVLPTDPHAPAVMTTMASSPIHTATETHDSESSEEEELAAETFDRAPPTEMYTRIAQVGEGTYGQVFKAKSESTGILVALKKIRMEAEKDGFPITAMREIKLLQMLRHPNVVRLHEMMTTSIRGSVYMVFEYMEHDLNGVLHHPDIRFTPAHLKSLSGQLLAGLDHLHQRSVLHRDLKGSNILLNNAGQLKLADFGLARLYAKRRQADYTNRVVTLWYRPPELLLGATQYGSEVDAWGAGCILLELFMRKAVFQGTDEIHQVQTIVDVLGPMNEARWKGVEALPWWDLIKPAEPQLDDEERSQDKERDEAFWIGRFRSRLLEAGVPSSALDVIQALLLYDPQLRASAQQALDMPYFTQERPKARRPAEVLKGLKGEWHELESRRARAKGRSTAAVVANEKTN